MWVQFSFDTHQIFVENRHHPRALKGQPPSRGRRMFLADFGTRACTAISLLSLKLEEKIKKWCLEEKFTWKVMWKLCLVKNTLLKSLVSRKTKQTNCDTSCARERESTRWERAEKPLEKLAEFPRTTRKTTWNAQRDGSQHNIARAQHIAATQVLAFSSWKRSNFPANFKLINKTQKLLQESFVNGKSPTVFRALATHFQVLFYQI